ncbi:MAG: hypothetical protein M9936_13495 [Caldilinea sp.]|nr:hypothetical protein [Caldilineaceae bacterium]MCB9122654.1 hypothetical protein [Caldilineaceae bacterium]MCO5210702.1 hypothetical protein [Caldilinea sp.]MCW5844363.1 hypothetical protein [Caldilinea sp.]
MSERAIYVPPGGPPRVAAPDPAIYEQMGLDAIVQMIEDFYAELAQSAIREMFPDDMVAASRKSAAFFVGLLGGPPLYHQLYGNPAMRARHMPFPIDEAARQEWLRCFDAVLADAPTRYNFPAEHLAGFRTFLHGFSAWMVNTAPPDG